LAESWAAGMLSGVSTVAAYFSQSAGSLTLESIGSMYICSGICACTCLLSRKSTNFRAPTSFWAPAITPAYSTCRKQVWVRAWVACS